MEKIKFADKIEKIQSRYKCIDDLMSGGIEPEIITEFYGEGGSGKTNIAMVYSYSVIKNGKPIIYIDTEGFSIERFSQIAGSDDDVFREMNLYRARSLDDQYLAIIKAEKLIKDKCSSNKSIGLLVVDSFTNFFRMETGTDPIARMEGYEKQLNILAGIASKYRIPVIITNQIYEDVENKSLEPFGGFFIDHAMKAIFRIDRKGNGIRKLTVTKHRSIPENLFTEFKIVGNGLSCEV